MLGIEEAPGSLENISLPGDANRGRCARIKKYRIESNWTGECGVLAGSSSKGISSRYERGPDVMRENGTKRSAARSLARHSSRLLAKSHANARRRDFPRDESTPTMVIAQNLTARALIRIIRQDGLIYVVISCKRAQSDCSLFILLSFSNHFLKGHCGWSFHFENAIFVFLFGSFLSKVEIGFNQLIKF